ncbi:MAG: hypothetical protein HYZ58_02280 [Acidobacteria bacterium]|nr:hypothetical protein [Acidobacteriota bacterium]
MKKQLTGHPLMVVAPLLLGILLQPAFGSAQSPTIRLAVVPAPVDTGLLQELVPDFQAQTGYRVEVYSRPDLANLFAAARMGWADLIISHYGHPEVESFMTGGFGLWPHTVFANQSAVIGPREDPAQIRGLSDAAEALRRIIASGSRFVTTRTPTPKSIEQVLLASIGASPRGDWYLDLGLQGDAAFPVADRLGAYTIFGLQPFLTWQEKCSPLDGPTAPGPANTQLVTLTGPANAPNATGSACRLEPLVVDDPFLQRLMVSIVVNPDTVPGVNAQGAKAFQAYLLTPMVQARIARFRDPRTHHRTWWPSGLHNAETRR